MTIFRFSAAVLAGAAALWAGYQPTISDSLTSIDSSKWTQSGNLSSTPNGITGDGTLISTVASPTGSDYDIRVTIRTANQGTCSGSHVLYGP